ncbi:hypothetical protein PTTG_26931 [Puccinia triticina 1-1 BBBD Race 1]|uniref:Uncharacterized protein n=2 Tax=Puccinia triticina TaxID=208348 RepID=A0A180GPD2_PUCT1|nr:uncharacterized protein PtA15_5A129 [Puccinia triticina]OAV94580.1 hypothetical protein PTTG_26931 [Puccinia triticina 1-1 BBBD Race 1]WAQ84559.1 hypothetical protein PtA15_5A129 [Puccinia triticina]WAR57904.1 hypothetical protein PtB15_5B134 [Puccinia triticina]
MTYPSASLAFSSNSAAPTLAPQKPSQTHSEAVNPPLTTINYVTTIEKTVVLQSPTGVAQAASAAAYAKVNPGTWVPLLVFVTILLCGAIVFGWITIKRWRANGFRILSSRKFRKHQRQEDGVLVLNSISSVRATGESFDLNNFAIKNRAAPSIPVEGQNLRCEKFPIKDRPTPPILVEERQGPRCKNAPGITRPAPTLTVEEQNQRCEKVERTLLILEGKAKRPPPSPLKPLPPGIV